MMCKMASRNIMSVLLLYLMFVSARANDLEVIQHQTSTSTGGILSFTCIAKEPIESCRMYNPHRGLWWKIPEKSYEDRLYDLSLGVKHVYNGRGYQYGECGILITRANFKYNGTWKCQVQTKESGKVLEGTTQLNVFARATEQDLSAIALQSFSKTNDDHAALICHSEKPIQKCEFKPPNKKHWIQFKNSSLEVSVINRETNNRHLYYGTGLKNGDCGIFIRNIRRQDSGNWECQATGLDNSFVISTVVPLNVIDLSAKSLPIERSLSISEEDLLEVSPTESSTGTVMMTNATLAGVIVLTALVTVLAVMGIVITFCPKQKYSSYKENITLGLNPQKVVSPPESESLRTKLILPA